jgi:predicted ATPase
MNIVSRGRSFAHRHRAIYTPDDERIQDWEEAIASDRAVCAAWRDHGYALIDLPMVSAEERASFVLAHL